MKEIITFWHFKWFAIKSDNIQNNPDRAVSILELVKYAEIIDIKKHYNVIDYPNQQIYILKYKNYPWCLFWTPIIEDWKKYFFIATAVQNRKYKKLYPNHFNND